MNNTSSSANQRLEMLAHGAIAPTLFRLSAPAIAGMIVIAVYNIVDTFFVSLLRDTTAVAARGIVFPVFQLIGAVGLTFGMGAASVVSRRLGAKDYQGANQVAATALYSAMGIGLLVSFAGAVFTVSILRFFGATDSILATATLYGRVIVGGSVFQMINMTTNNLLRSEGAAFHSSFGQILGAVLNIALDPVFIFVLDMGVSGAAVATVISQAVSAAWLLGYYARRRGVLHPLCLRHLRLSREIHGQIMHLGFPTFVRQVLGSISFGILNATAGTWGDAAIAAVSITLRLFMLVFMALAGLAQGLQPLAGYNFGAHQYRRVRSTLRLVFGVAASVGLVAGGVGFVFAPGIMQFFAPQDATVVAMGVQALRILSIVMVPFGLVIMFGGVFQALGDGRSALLLAAGQQGLFLIPMVIVLPRVFGLVGLFTAMPAGFLLAFLVGLVLLNKTLRKIPQEDRNLAA